MKLRCGTIKLTIASAFLFIFWVDAKGQDIKNTEWFEIKRERKDGSSIISRAGLPAENIKYLFKDDTAFIAVNAGYSFGQKFSASNNILSIGEALQYNIDTLTNLVLSLTEIPGQQLADDKINRYVFVNSKYIFEYLTQIGQINIIGDSLIECNSLFSPTCKEEIAKLLLKNFKPGTIAATLNGYIIMSHDGKIENVLTEPNNKFRRKEIDRFISIIQSTGYLWIVPPIAGNLSFKIDFSCEVFYRSHTSGITFWLQHKEPGVFFQKNYSARQEPTAEQYYSKAIEFNKREQYEKAVTQFVKCIEIDSLYLDAYYGKAFACQKLHNNNEACKIWGKLKEMGQKRGEILYDENCKK